MTEKHSKPTGHGTWQGDILGYPAKLSSRINSVDLQPPVFELAVLGFGSQGSRGDGLPLVLGVGKQLSVQPGQVQTSMGKTGISRNQLVEEAGGSLVKGHRGPTPGLMSSGPGLEGVEVEWFQSILGITKLNESLSRDNQETLQLQEHLHIYVQGHVLWSTWPYAILSLNQVPVLTQPLPSSPETLSKPLALRHIH